MRYTDRFEYKYVLDVRTYFAFKNKLIEFMDLDYHTKILADRKYFVRSLYYDTRHYDHYTESDEGQYGRIKCRVRTYHKNLEDSDVISVEIKSKHGSNVIKYSELISTKEYQYFIDHHSFNKKSQVLDEFTRLLYQGQLEPKLIVEYEREGYIPKDNSDFRLTFDHQVRSCHSKTLFVESDKTRFHNHAIVCEIKCGMDKPPWLEAMISHYGLKIIRNSKYVQAVQLIYPNIIGDKK